MEINISWNDIKGFIASRKAPLQYFVANNTYYLFASDGPIAVTANIPMDGSALSDQSDFETNFQLNANSPLLPLITTVTTQFEKRDKTLKLAHGSASVGNDSKATILIKIPGTPGSSDGRWISSGTGFFDFFTPGDLIESVRFTDEDNILGYGVGTIVGSYTDDDLDLTNQGWAIPPIGHLQCVAIGGYGFAPAGFYIKVVGKKSNGITTGNFYVNLEWGKVE